MIHHKCPNCKQILNIPDEYANTTGKCKYCRYEFVVPDITWRAKFDGGIKDLCRVGCGGFMLIFMISMIMVSWDMDNYPTQKSRPTPRVKSGMEELKPSAPVSPPKQIVKQVKPPSQKTLPPISALTFSEIRSNHERMTDVQWDSYSRSLKGKRVSWSGWISDVTESYSGRYRVLVDMDSPNAILSVFDVNFEVPTNIAMKLTKDNSITFVGTIKNASTFIISMDIDLENVTIIPSKTTRPPSMIDEMLSKPKHTKPVTPQYESSKRNNSSFNPQSHANKLKKGMTYNQVVKVMGCHGEKGMEMNWGDGDIHRTMKWSWSGNMFKGESSGFISVQFINDRVDGWTFFSL